MNIVCIGGGVIGGGWAARFARHGHCVTVFDPSPASAQTVAAAGQAAQRAWELLTETAAPAAAGGTVQVVHNAGALPPLLAAADFVQENLPEQEALKQRVLAEIEPHLAADTIIASSTSGLLPSRLQSVLAQPQRFCVAHPFTPVYLLPLVELCGGSATAAETLDRAAAVYRALAMRPLVVQKEIDGFIADRLMEALWREALWLVNDGVATTGEIDDAIRLGCGLRWAFMGPFLTYRLGGGEGGMRHFMAQFAPALKLPWTKLMDTPEMTPALLDEIVTQSDEQAAGASVAELMEWRDRCLVGIMHSLAQAGTGLGEVFAVAQPAQLPALAEEDTVAAEPLVLHRTQVAAVWIDYNGHMNEARYLQVFSDASDALLRFVGADAEYVKTDGGYYTVETHLRHIAEAFAGEQIAVATQLLAADEKRLHVFHTLQRDGETLATAEQMLLHVAHSKVTPVKQAIAARVRKIAAAHAELPPPEGAGKLAGKR